MSADGVIGFSERNAQTWASYRSRMRLLFEKAWLDRFTVLVPAGATILDLGCGFGKPIAAYLPSQGFDACGVDSSSSMIGMAKANSPDREWIVADMCSLSLGRRFSGIMAWDSFFHLDHDAQRRMFPIFREHAKPGAPLIRRSAAWRSNRKPVWRAALPRKPGAGRISRAARHERFRRCRCPHGRSGLRLPFSLAGAARRRLDRA